MKTIYNKYIKMIAIIWAACFVLFVILNILLFAPQKRNRIQTEQQLAEKKQTYESALKASQKETRVWLNKQIKELRNGLQNYVIDFEDSANLTFDISQIANNRMLNSFSIKTKDNRRNSSILDSKYIGTNQIDVSFKSSFSQFASFINELERHHPIVFVDKFSITRSEKSNSSHKAHMNLAFFTKKRLDG